VVPDPGMPAVNGELRIERLAWPEIRDELEAGNETVICVVGSIEQHGPHLPCETRGLRQQDMPAVQADLIETSIMLALHPTLVRRDRIEPGFVGDLDLEDSFAARGLKALSDNGILGDPRAATAELGEEILAHLEQYLLDVIAAGSQERA
jgi:creatinine amidohydrolase/Fe(II)-dependent formamide hydrolase-like protein